LKKKRKPVPLHLNVELLALPLQRAVDKYTNLDVDQFLNPNQHQLLLHQVGLHLSLTHRTKIHNLLNLVNLKAKRKRTSHLILLKPLPRARKRLKLK